VVRWKDGAMSLSYPALRSVDDAGFWNSWWPLCCLLGGGWKGVCVLPNSSVPLIGQHGIGNPVRVV
jgi:hypothetical protein